MSAVLCIGGVGIVAGHVLGHGVAALAVTAIVGGGLYAVALWRFRKLLHLSVLRAAGRRGVGSTPHASRSGLIEAREFRLSGSGQEKRTCGSVAEE